VAAGPTPTPQEQLAQQRIQYDENAPKTILELQQFRTTTQVELKRANGTPGIAKLINLNPETNAWYILSIEWSGRYPSTSYHLELPEHATGELHLTATAGAHVLNIAIGSSPPCQLWSDGSKNELEEARDSDLPYAPLCSGSLYLRDPVVGHRTSLERVTDFLRDRVWGGERVVEFVKREFYKDKFLERTTTGESPAKSLTGLVGGPGPAEVAPETAAQALVTEHLGIDIEVPGHEVLPGQWYAVRDVPGVAVSAIAPQYISKRILLSRQASVNTLGPAESTALAYLVAFDLQTLDLHYALGTDHPRLEWSDRPPPSSQDSRLPGPDGIDSATPLVTNGMISPSDTARTVAAFAGGFKRSHGAFKFGPFATRNHGSHYGFVEEGVVFSKLQPGLATVFVNNDGQLDVSTWTIAANASLEHIRYARQNGVPLIQFDPARGIGVPGDLVNLWGAGNWSGSTKEDLRTVRAGLCLQQRDQRRYLLYAYFSGATPSAMARVFQAYGCRYAMHLDMNALEHTYLALYVRQGSQMAVEHVIDGMDVLDRTARRRLAPRFLAFPDDRDFFYFTRKAGGR
jgi:hypothetical protein